MKKVEFERKKKDRETENKRWETLKQEKKICEGISLIVHFFDRGEEEGNDF